MNGQPGAYPGNSPANYNQATGQLPLYWELNFLLNLQ
jgi:hypothetical protein